MNIRQSRVCSIVFAGTLVVAGSALAQPVGVAGGVPGGGGGVQRDEDSRRLQKPSGLDFQLDSLEDFEGFKNLEGLKGLEGLKALDSLKGLAGLKGLEGLKSMEGFKGLADFADLHQHLFEIDKSFAFHDSGRTFAFQKDKDRDGDRQAELERRERERETRAYDQAREFLDQGKYDRAIERYTDVIAMKGAHADAALYWKAWSQSRAGQRPEALTTISALARDYPKSRYQTQAKQLEAEVRRDSGQPVRPDSINDDDLKILAINALLNADSEQAIPMLEKLLEGTASPKLKSRALFVLAQSSSPRAREVLKNVAKGNSTPDLQSRAIDYLGQHGGRESRATLGEIYTSTSDVDVKRRILRAFMVAGEKDRLLSAAQTEQNADLRGEAVQQLGVMGAHDELWQLYQKETAVDVKKRIIRAMFTGGNVARMIDLAKTEQNPELRRTAVANLGIMDSKRTSDALLEIYSSEKDPAIRRTVVQGLFQQSNATALVGLARKEQDPALKRDIVQKLSVMDHNPVATAYMVELLNAK
jgi:HEAT repeat protein